MQLLMYTGLQLSPTVYQGSISFSQVLQKKFEEFCRDVNGGMERYTASNRMARRLVAEGHSDTVLIKEKQDTMR